MATHVLINICIEFRSPHVEGRKPYQVPLHLLEGASSDGNARLSVGRHAVVHICSRGQISHIHQKRYENYQTIDVDNQPQRSDRESRLSDAVL